jgi:serine/threonine protein kinase
MISSISKNERFYYLENLMNIEKFDFYELLHKRSFGEVYPALDKSSKQIVSIKRITIPQSQQTSEWKEEMKTIKKLNHPQTVKCQDIFEDSGKFYIVMEYIECENLFAHLQNRQKKIIFYPSNSF